MNDKELPSAALPQGSGHHILIIDDDEGICRSLRLIFRKKGYEVETAGTGREAIEKAQGRFFNLAFLDIRLPDTAGIELLTPLKALHPDMVVILVTGYASLETAVQALNEGASAYITKPLNMDEVLATVREALEKQRLVMENRQLYQAAQRELAERRRAEEALKEYSERLEDMVEERTRELRDAQAQLILSERLAAIGQIGASVCHELGNPLGVINNSVYYLNTKLGEADGRVKRHLEIMKREIARAKKITRDLLSLSEENKPSQQLVQVNTIVRSALLNTTVPDGVAVITELGEGLPPMMADPNQMEQVFINLILNAFQAVTSSTSGPAGFGESFSGVGPGPSQGIQDRLNRAADTLNGAKLEISTREREGFIEVEFRDNGCGISEENLRKLFQPLFTTKARGIGLGLPLSKKMIEAHSGSIEVESEVEKGTTFRVRLPKADLPFIRHGGEAWIIKVTS